MIRRPRVTAGVERLDERTRRPPEADDSGSTPYQKLLGSAGKGQFESLVRKARPTEPAAMVTPEEREAELRAAGQWPDDKPAPKPAPKTQRPPAEPERALSPNEQYIEEKCDWRHRGPNDYPRPTHAYGQCLTDYDPITGEVEGDGYTHREDDDAC